MNKKLLPQNIWLAGLGAIARAEREGDTWLEELIAEGEVYEQEKIDSINQVLQNVKEDVKEKAEAGTQKITQRFGDIEQAFEDRVTDTLKRLGMASGEDLTVLNGRVQKLESLLRDLQQQAKSAPEPQQAELEEPEVSVERLI